MNGDVHEHLVMFMNITMGIDVFMNIPATFMNIKCAKKSALETDLRDVIFMNIRPRLGGRREPLLR